MDKPSPHAHPTQKRRVLTPLLATLLLAIALVIGGCTGAITAPAEPQEAVPAVDQPDDPAPANLEGAEDAEDTENQEASEESIRQAIADFLVEDPSGEEYNGVPVGFTAGGLAYRGDPEAPVIMIEFSDYQCPYCARHFVQTEPAITEKYVRSGSVRAVFNDFPLEQLHPSAPDAHAAGICVADQGSAAVYWKMHGELFRSSEEWGNAADPQTVFARLAEEAGADMDAFADCVEGEAGIDAVDQRVIYAQRRGLNGTPSFQFVRIADGALFQVEGAQPFEQFEALIDAILAGESPEALAQANAQADAGIPLWATPEGWAPDPDRPGYNMAGDQYKGSTDAPIAMIEFSDFQCPFCKRHAEESQPILDEQYVDTGKVLWVFKHFPLDSHPAAPNAGAAAECAAEQGKFWEMHELLFAEQQAWSVDDPDAVLVTLAEQLGLDIDAFGACLIDPATLERVISDFQEGVPFIRATPSFVVVFKGQGSIIQGALPVEQFVQVFEEIATLLESN